MRAYNHLLVLLFSVAFTLAVADINTVRKEAINKLNNYANSMKKLADETSAEVSRREENIKIISKHMKEFGDGINDNTIFQVKKTAASAYMMAQLMESKNEVFRCIEGREREALDEISKYYSEKFLNPGRDYEVKAEQHQRNVIKAWKDDYYTASSQYGDIYKKSVTDIQKSTSESNISLIVRRFEETTSQMAGIITNIHPTMAKVHIEVLRTFDQLVRNFQQYAKYRVEETTKAIHNCFSKLLQEEETIL